MAREAEIPCADIAGTGPGGRIVRADVEQAIRALPAPPAVAPTAAPPAQEPVGPGDAGYLEVPHSRMRRAIAAGLIESKRTAPHFYLRGVADVGELLGLREQINETSPIRISVNDLVVMAVARAHLAVPRMNVTWAETAVRQYAGVDVALAVSTDDGLLTPVVRGCDRMSLSTLARTTKDLGERARAGQIRPAELSGGTITVSNLGMFGTVEFAAIINPPQAAILAVGAITQEVAWAAHGKRGKPKACPVSRMRVTLSVDHRPVDGAVAAAWMQQLVALLENPLRILL
jgi:pyruvate dehydrogenase E2 component (dihydrolipoamide acetyltransferase)